MDTNIISRLVRVGRVSSLDVENMAARVVFPDMDNSVSDTLPILTFGSALAKAYWMPDIDEQVVCLMIPNASSKGSNDGFILGSFFSDEDRPVVSGATIRRIDFGDGSYVSHDRATGNMEIHATGAITITGSQVNIN